MQRREVMRVRRLPAMARRLLSLGETPEPIMKPFPHALASLLVAGAALATVPAMTGCFAAEGVYVVEDAPPPPREEVVITKPGYVWVHGRWTHPGRHWSWQGGHYEAARPEQTYVDGRWERRDGGHVWVAGTWHARSSVVLRDQR
jgi:hypothetical protein